MRNKYKGQIIFVILIIGVVIVVRNFLTDFKFLNHVINSDVNNEAGSLIDHQVKESDCPPCKQSVPHAGRQNRGIAEYSPDFMQRLSVLAKREAKSNDPELIQLIRDALDSPAATQLKNTRIVVETPQVTEVIALHNKKRGGFFIECGGLDGERSSNTIYLEKELGWTGLLIEMDPHYYTQLLGKNRKSWSINACLSPYDYVIELPFHGDSGGAGRIDLTKRDSHKSVPCFPFESIMLALNQSHVDYFSLDVEGVELNILKTIPFARIMIDMFSVEYGHAASKNATREYMLGQGYYVHKDIHTANPSISLYVEDFIFVRNGFKPVPNDSAKV